MTKKKFIFLLSHLIQYFSPFFQRMAKEENIDLLVLYCSDQNIKGHLDRGFGVNVEWDIPLLDGYKYKFLKNNSWKPSIFTGFFGLLNLEIIKILFKMEKSIIIIGGWNYFTYIIAIIIGKAAGHKICVRGDNNYSGEAKKSGILIFFKKIALGQILFRFIDTFMYVGKQNKEFYKYYSVPEKKLLFTPHAVDNSSFSKYFLTHKNDRKKIREKLGFSDDLKIILFIGKLIDVKRPFDLLYAFQRLDIEKALLLYVGDGELRNQLQSEVQEKKIGNVRFIGFINQSEILKYYLIADVFVICSESETWGLAVNEAMNFFLPVVSSDTVGCIDDLLDHGNNGFIYEKGNIEKFSFFLNKILTDDEFRLNAGAESFRKINEYSYEKIIEHILQHEY